MMKQLDKVILIIPENGNGSMNFGDVSFSAHSSSITICDCAEGRTRIGTTSLRINRQVAIQTIPLSKAMSSVTMMQMYMRRSSVAVTVLPRGIDRQDAAKILLMSASVCRGYNESAPCTGPNTELIIITNDDSLSFLNFLLERANKYTKSFSIATHVAIAHDGIHIDKPESYPNITIRNYHNATTIMQILDSKILSNDLHWDKIPLIEDEAEHTISVIQEDVRKSRRQNRKIVDVIDIIKHMSKPEPEGTTFHQVENILDFLDKSGEIRYYPLTGHAFIDIENYRKVVEHVLRKIRALDKTHQEITVINILEISDGSEYLQACDGNTSRDIIRSLTEELVHSGVVSRHQGLMREYVVHVPATERVLSDVFKKEHRDIPPAIAVALAERGYKIVGGPHFAATGEGNNGIAIIPWTKDNPNNIIMTALYSISEGEKMPRYLDAMSDPMGNLNIISELWSTRTVSEPTKLFAGINFLGKLRKLLSVRNSLEVFTADMKRVFHDHAPDLQMQLNLVFVDDILKPQKAGLAEWARSVLINFAMQSTSDPEANELPDIIRNATDTLSAMQSERAPL